MSLSKKIISIRKENNLNQESLAEILNVSRQTVSNWENNKCYPDIETLILISDKFNLSLDTLLKDDMKMIREIDKKVEKNSQLKKIIIVLSIILFAIIFFLVSKNYIEKTQKEKDNVRYQEIINNLNILGFSKRDGIGFSKINEADIEYSIYSKMPGVLEKDISARTTKGDILILASYNGKRVAVTYVNNEKTTIYCDTKGNLLNEKQNKNHTEVYNSHKAKTIEIVTRMVELADAVYE